MAEPIKWITINGRHIPVFEDGIHVSRSKVLKTKTKKDVAIRLKPYGDTDYHTPFPYIDMETGNEIARFNFRMGKYEGLPNVKEMNMPVEEISFSDMYNNQADIDKKKMDKLLELSVSELKGIKDTTTSSDIPYVIEYNGKYQIQDGHHRLAALYVKGEQTAQVRVLHLADVLKKRK